MPQLPRGSANNPLGGSDGMNYDHESLHNVKIVIDNLGPTLQMSPRLHGGEEPSGLNNTLSMSIMPLDGEISIIKVRDGLSVMTSFPS